MSIKYLFYCYLIIVNIVAFFMYAIDKRKAKKDKRRISEASLLTVACIGGAVGALAAMNICRHKTQKFKFAVGIPVIIVLQIAILGYVFRNIFVW